MRPRDYWREAVYLRNQMARCFQETLLGQEIRPKLLLTILNLHLTAREIKTTLAPTDRRNLIREFDHQRAVVKQIISRAYQETGNYRLTKNQKPKSKQAA